MSVILHRVALASKGKTDVCTQDIRDKIMRMMKLRLVASYATEIS